MNKRDGSHWELFNCHPTTEKRQTVQAICTDTSSESNCHDVFEDGAEHTVIEMPDGCGPGRYAMVVSLARSQNYSIILPRHLEGRRGIDRRVYDLTFDYDFTAVNKRASTNVLMRIDYSDDPGYWEKVVGMLSLLNSYLNSHVGHSCPRQPKTETTTRARGQGRAWRRL